MARRDDVGWAFRQAVNIDPRSMRTVTTSGFASELAKYNWHWTPRQVNEWIEIYVTTFADTST